MLGTRLASPLLAMRYVVNQMVDQTFARQPWLARDGNRERGPTTLSGRGVSCTRVVATQVAIVCDCARTPRISFQQHFKQTHTQK